MRLYKKGNQQGIAMVEALISFLLLSISGVYFYQSVGVSNNISTFTRHRWKAQVITESVGLAVSSLSNQDLYKLLDDEATSGAVNLPGTFYRENSQAWLLSWNQHDPEVQSIKFKIELFDLSSVVHDSSTSIKVVPEEYILDEYHKKITVKLIYLSSSKSSSIQDRKRTIEWTKWIVGK